MGEGEPETNLFRAPAGPIEREDATSVHQRRDAGPFAHDRYLFRQRHLALAERYQVLDAEGNVLIHVERTSTVLGSLIVAALASVTFLAVAGASAYYAYDLGVDVLIPVVLSGMFAATGAALFIARLFAVRREVSATFDEERTRPALAISQDARFQPIIGRFTVRDGEGRVVAKLRKNWLANVVRRRWACLGPDGDPICELVEDAVHLALARRLLGSLFGLLRTGFVILEPEGRIVGRFSRMFTLLDRYELDLRKDLDGVVDRRIAVALGIMVDAAERR